MKTRGASTVEYALVLVVMVVVGGAGLKAIGAKTFGRAPEASEVLGAPHHEHAPPAYESGRQPK